MNAAPPEDTLNTEKEMENAPETEREIILATDLGRLQNHRDVVNDSITSPREDTVTSERQDGPPSQQVIAIHQRIWSEDARHTHRINTLHQQARSEHERHITKDQTFRSRLVQISNKQLERLRKSPAKSLAKPNNDARDATKQLGGNVAKWLDGLRSISSISEFWGSSDVSSSVEVVAAKDAKGRGKGIRIVSDGVEETDADVFSTAYRAGKAKSN